MSADKTNILEVFRICPVCQGRRFVGPFKACAECHGLGRFALWQNDYLYWDYGINGWHILLRYWQRLIRLTVDGALLLLVALNLYRLYALFSISGLDPRILFRLLFLSHQHFVGLFWLLLIFNFYFIYRLLRRAEIKRQSLIDSRPRLGAERSRRLNIASALSPALVKILDNTWMTVNGQRQLPVRALHLFLSLLSHKDIRVMLARLGLQADVLSTAVARQAAYYAPENHDGLSAEVENTMLNAYLLASKDRSSLVRSTDVLLATVMASPKLQEILYDVSVDLEKLTNVVRWIHFNRELASRFQRWRGKSVYKPKGPINRSFTAAATPYLDSFSQDLTQAARAGALPLSVARDKELEEVYRVMEGGQRGIILVGEQGVGKENIIEGLANRMSAEEVPLLFNDKRLVSLSLPFLVAGAAQTGEVQERLLLVIQEIVRSGNIILFIPDIHNLVGVSSSGTANIDLSEVLAQQIQSYNILVIATTTPKDFTEYVEGGPLAQVLEAVKIGEPGRNETIQILEANVGAIEAQHKVFFTYQALEKVVSLSDRYLHDQFLPSKALSLLAEVGAWSAKRKDKLITGEDIAALVSHKTKIPLTQVSAKESEALLNLEATIHQRIVGQDEAVKLVVQALRRARAELRDEKRPIINLLFLGPTGVGKTELSKVVAASYFGADTAMIRLDMSEYQASDSIARLIGVPGGTGGGVLTEAVRKNPFALLLLDEIEKAHPDILNIFLQVMDDGRLTDVSGRTIDFTNVILIATSNAAANYIQDEVAKRTPAEKLRETLIKEKLRDYFRPEFLNRFDGIVVFKPLTEEEIFQIAGLLLAGVRKRLETKGIALVVTEGAQRELAAAGFDPVFGARPLRRVIQERVDDALANYLLKGAIGRRDQVVLDVGAKITVNKAEKI